MKWPLLMSWPFCFVEFMDFLDKNSKISGLQSGNRKFHCTETTLLHYTDQLRRKMDVVLLYMSNAFDSIQHDNLLSKLHLLGVSASALASFESYLWLRKQVVGIGSDLSAHYAACDLLDHQRLEWKQKRFDHFKLRRISWGGLPLEHKAQQLRMHFVMLGISWKEPFA